MKNVYNKRISIFEKYIKAIGFSASVGVVILLI